MKALTTIDLRFVFVNLLLFVKSIKKEYIFLLMFLSYFTVLFGNISINKNMWLLPPNNVPTDIKLDGGDTDFINENRPVGSLVSILSSNDTDPGDTLTFSLVSGVGDTDNSSFYIERHNKLMLNIVPDFETKNAYSIRLRVDDGNGGVYEEAFSISVIDIITETTDASQGIRVWDFNDHNDYDISDIDKLKVDQGVAQLISVSEFQVNDAVNNWQAHSASALLNNGNIVIVWQSNDNNHTTNATGQTNDNDQSHIAAKIIDPRGEVVIPEFQVNDEIESWQDYPDVTILQNGQIFISWYTKDINHTTNSVGQANDNDEEHIAAKIYNPDGSVAVSEFQVNDEIELREYFPNASVLNNGQVFITWASSDTLHATNAVGQDNDGSIRHIAAKILNSNGTTAVSEFQINDEVEDLQTHPKAVIMNDGRIFIVWASKDHNHTTNAIGQANDDDHYHIAAKIYNPDGTTSVPEFQINDEIDEIQDLPIPAVLKNGQIIITWETKDFIHSTNFAGQDNDDSGFHIAAKIYNPDATVAKPEFQVNDQVYSDQKEPRLVVLENGKIFVTWQSKDHIHSTNPTLFPKDGDNYHIAAKILNADGTTSLGEFQVNYEVELWQTDPDILLLANGNVLITWYSKDNYHSTSVAGQTYDNDVNHIAGIILSKDGVAEEFPASYATTKPYVSFDTPLAFKTTINTFETILSNNNEGSIKYQVSNDGGTTWKYFDGSSWQMTSSNDGSNTNTEAEINNHITTLADDGGSFNCRAFLISNGSQKVELDQINVTYTLSYDILGTAWYDENGDGVMDVTEVTGLQDITVKLINDTNHNGVYDLGETVFKQTTTSPNGTYKFEKVFDGDYVIVIDFLDPALNNDPVNNSLTYGLTTLGEIAVNVNGLDISDMNFGFDDAKVSLSIDQDSIPENGGIAIVEVSIHPTTGFNTTITLSTSGVAIDGIDYVDQADNGLLNNKSVVITFGNSSETINILAVDDATVENDESIIVDINTVTNATEDGIQRDSTKILDDDANPAIEVTKTSVIADNNPIGTGVGDLITYTITVENTGNVELFDIGLTDYFRDFNNIALALDYGPIFVSSDGGSPEGQLEIGEIATYTAAHTITQSDVDANGVQNNATASGHDSNGTWVSDISDDGDDLDGNTTDDPTEDPLLDIMIVDVCNCDDQLNYRGINTYFFHEHIIVKGEDGLTVSIDFNTSSNIYDNNENLLNGNIILNESSSGIYEYDFWAKYSEPYTFGVEANNDASAQIRAECSEICNKTFAKNDVNTTQKDLPVSGNVLSNDTDPEGDNQIVNTTPVINPSNGSLILNSDGSYTYSPNQGFVGTDIFRYHVCDDAPISVCDMADVYIEVFENNNHNNNPPIGVSDFNQTTKNKTAFGNVLVNDSDPDFDNIFATETPVFNASNGSLILQSNGNYQYSPNLNFIGRDTFYYRLCDDGNPSLCDTTIAVIEVIDRNISNTTFANDDAYTMMQNESLTGNVSDNDFDPEGDNTMVNTIPVSVPAHGTLTLQQDGSFIYTPVHEFFGNDQFVYEVCDDGNPTACNRATVYISVLEEPFAVIGDYVWHDKDGDGIQDTNEPGISGVKVHLYSVKRTIVKTVTTDNQGKYLFDEIEPGEYYLQFDLPDGYTDATDDNMGSDDSIDSDADGTNGYLTTDYFIVDKRDTLNTLDAGFYKCANIGDLVWLDYHENNVYDSDENGINGLQVNLYRLYKGNWILWDFKYTGINSNSICGDGYFSFCTNPGTYYLKFVTPPNGLVPAQPFYGNDRTKDSDITNANGKGTTYSFKIYSGESNNTIDAGYYGMSTIKNSLVWLDDNYNGIRESEESGLPNTQVEIFNAYGDLYSTTYTDENGEYNLDYLQAEDYYLKFNIPGQYSSYTFTINNQGDDNHDSDVTGDYGYGTTDLFGLAPKENKEHQDAGLTLGTLPLNYLSIGAKWINDEVKVYWMTANEINVDKFIVQRSFDDNQIFEKVGEVKAKGKKANSYHLFDTGEFKEGVYYYRIIEVDNDGNSQISKIVAVFVGNETEKDLFNIYPNPATTQTTVHLNLVNDSEIKIDLFDIDGKILRKGIVNNKMTKGVYNIDVNTSDLKPATYFFRIKSNTKVIFEKLILLGR